MRVRSLLTTAIACLSAVCASGQTVSSPPKTEGEQRLLQWDLNKSFVPKGRGLSSSPAFGSKAFNAPSIEPKAFATKAAAESATFYTPEFLSSPSGAPKNATTGVSQRFSTARAAAENIPAETQKFQSEKKEFTPKSASLANSADAKIGTKEFPGASRVYSGEEAERMKRAYTPENAPKGGVSMGRQLSVDEVREILNRSK